MKKTFLLCAGLLGPVSAFAASPAATGIGLFGGVAQLKAGDSGGSDTLDGYEFGLRGAYVFGDNVFVAGEYGHSELKISSDGIKVTFKPDELRIGGGLKYPFAKAGRLFAGGQYVRLEIDAKASDGTESFSGTTKFDGYTAFGGASYTISPGINFYGRLGYIAIKSTDDDNNKGDGYDLLAGVQYPITKSTGVFAEYRLTELEDEGDSLTFSGYRAGIHFTF